MVVQEDGSQLLDSIVGRGPMEDIDIVFPAHFSQDYLLHMSLNSSTHSHAYPNFTSRVLSAAF